MERTLGSSQPITLFRCNQTNHPVMYLPKLVYEYCKCQSHSRNAENEKAERCHLSVALPWLPQFKNGFMGNEHRAPRSVPGEASHISDCTFKQVICQILTLTMNHIPVTSFTDKFDI